MNEIETMPRFESVCVRFQLFLTALSSFKRRSLIDLSVGHPNSYVASDRQYFLIIKIKDKGNG